MAPNKTFRIILIVTVSTLVTILTPVQSKSVPVSGSFVARSLLSVNLPPSNPPSESESPSPAPEAPTSSISPANPPNDLDSDAPAASPEAPANSMSPTDTNTNSPAPSPEAPASSISPTDTNTNSPAPSPEAPTGSPAASPELPDDSTSPTNPPTTEIDTDSPVASPEAPDSISGPTLLNTPKNLLNQTLLSPEIKTICGKTDYPTLCESSVKPLLTAQLKPDPSSILILAIQASINATKEAMDSIDKVAAAECQEMYDVAVANLEDAINAVKARDIATVNTNLSAVITDYTTCNDGFEESGEPNLLVDVSAKLTKMASNCLAIATLIK